MATNAYPLCWPIGAPRTKLRERSRFKVTFGRARDNLLEELTSLGARDIVLSTNVPLRHDGIPYANEREPDDSGVAVYFSLKGRPHTMTCDRWYTVAANLQALNLTVEAMRGIARWGSMEMRDQAFSGFSALPPAMGDWRSVFAIKPQEAVSLDTVKTIYRAMALKAHPDVGGSTEVMTRLNAAWEAAERELGGVR